MSSSIRLRGLEYLTDLLVHLLRLSVQVARWLSTIDQTGRAARAPEPVLLLRTHWPHDQNQPDSVL